MPAEPVVRALLARSVDRLHLLCQSLLYKSYPRLTRGPLNLNADELLGGVVERLIKAMREIRPGNVRQFFALANQHMRWELNDLARRLDNRVAMMELHDSHAAPVDVSVGTRSSSPNSGSVSDVSSKMRLILQAIDALPEEEREVLTLVRMQSMTKSEAANVLGVSEKTVQRRLQRCLIRLADQIADVLPDLPSESSGDRPDKDVAGPPGQWA